MGRIVGRAWVGSFSDGSVEEKQGCLSLVLGSVLTQASRAAALLPQLGQEPLSLLPVLLGPPSPCRVPSLKGTGPSRAQVTHPCHTLAPEAT